METNHEIIDYLENVTGERPSMTPIPKDALAGLPVYLTLAYDIRELHLLGQTLTVALPNAKARRGLAQLTKDRALLSSKLGSDVVLLLPDVRSYERRQLVQKHIPFIVPGRQLFLPMLFVDLRETFGSRTSPQRSVMGWSAQMIILRHLLDGDVSGQPLTNVASVLGYSAMAVTYGVNELVALELCTKHTQGRAKTVQFGFSSKALWENALPHMRSPVKRRFFASVSDLQLPGALDAGLTALSQVTDLAYVGQKIVALPHKDIGRMVTDGALNKREYEDDAATIVEGWAYTPQQLSHGPAVDELSLYLSLKDDADDRVQMALANMMERREWLRD